MSLLYVLNPSPSSSHSTYRTSSIYPLQYQEMCRTLKLTFTSCPHIHTRFDRDFHHPLRPHHGSFSTCAAHQEVSYLITGACTECLDARWKREIEELDAEAARVVEAEIVAEKGKIEEEKKREVEKVAAGTGDDVDTRDEGRRV